MIEKKLSSKKIYESNVIDLYEDQVLVSNGIKAQRVVARHNGAAAVLPITSDNKIILTKQFRYPLNQVMIEIPAGKKDSKDELGIECAKRELEEETGYNSNDIEHIFDIHNAVGYSDEMIQIYIAYNCYKVENPLDSDPDEILENYIISIDEAKSMLDNKELTDVKTIVALQYFLSKSYR